MICQNCGGTVIWMGPLTALTHTECKDCGGINCHEAEEQPEEIELDPDCSPSVNEWMTLQLRARCNDFAQALAGKVMAQLRRGEPVRVLDKAKNPMVWQHAMTIRHHVPRILAFLGLPEIDETEREMTLALHEMFAACGIIDPQRIEVLVIEERDRPAPALDGTVIPFTLEDAGN